MSTVGYVVLCWNQASGRPDIDSELCDTATEAEIVRDAVAAHQAETSQRRERFTVAQVVSA